MADLGLLSSLGGIGQGFQNAINNFNTQRQFYANQRNIADQRAMQQKQMDLNAVNSGYTLDQSGNWTPTPMKQMQMEQQQNELQRQQELQDPNSEASQNVRQLNRAAIDQQFGAGKGAQMIPDNMSGAQVMDQNGTIRTALSSYGGLLGKEMYANAMMQRNGIQQGQLNRAMDEQAASAKTKIATDPIVRQKTQGLQAFDNAQSIMNQALQSGTFTEQDFSKIQQEIENGINMQRSGATDFKQKEAQYKSAPTSFYRLLHSVVGKTGDEIPPDFVQKAQQQIGLLKNRFEQDRYDWAKSRATKYSHNPDANSAQQEFLDSIRPDDQQMGQQRQPQAQAKGLLPRPQPTPMDTAAIQWAKSNPNDPRAAKILQLNGM